MRAQPPTPFPISSRPQTLTDTFFLFHFHFNQVLDGKEPLATLKEAKTVLFTHESGESPACALWRDATGLRLSQCVWTRSRQRRLKHMRKQHSPRLRRGQRDYLICNKRVRVSVEQSRRADNDAWPCPPRAGAPPEKRDARGRQWQHDFEQSSSRWL